MQLVNYRPQHFVSTRANNASRLFDGLMDDFFTPFISTVAPKNISSNLSLKVDIYEKDEVVIIDAELPGVAKEDLFIDTKGRNVTLGGELKSDESIKQENSYRRERRYGKFERTFSLPFEVSADSVKATFSNGVLRLEIPKPAEETVKKIEIQ